VFQVDEAGNLAFGCDLCTNFGVFRPTNEHAAVVFLLGWRRIDLPERRHVLHCPKCFDKHANPGKVHE